MKRDLIETYKVLTVKEKSDRDKFLYWVKTTIISVDTCSSCISLEVVSTSGNSSTVNVWWMHGTICQATSLKLEIVMTYILVKSVSTVVTTTVLDSTICVYTSVVPVNMLQVYTLGCYYWSWYLTRRGLQQISTTTTSHWSWNGHYVQESASSPLHLQVQVSTNCTSK